MFKCCGTMSKVERKKKRKFNRKELCLVSTNQSNLKRKLKMEATKSEFCSMDQECCISKHLKKASNWAKSPSLLKLRTVLCPLKCQSMTLVTYKPASFCIKWQLDVKSKIWKMTDWSMSPKMRSRLWLSNMASLRSLQVSLELIKTLGNLCLNLPCKLVMFLKKFLEVLDHLVDVLHLHLWWWCVKALLLHLEKSWDVTKGPICRHGPTCMAGDLHLEQQILCHPRLWDPH